MTPSHTSGRRDRPARATPGPFLGVRLAKAAGDLLHDTAWAAVFLVTFAALGPVFAVVAGLRSLWGGLRACHARWARVVTVHRMVQAGASRAEIEDYIARP